MHFELVHENGACECVSLTVPDDGQDGQIHLSLPVGALLQSDAVTRGGEDVPGRKDVKTHTHTHVHKPSILPFQ